MTGVIATLLVGTLSAILVVAGLVGANTAYRGSAGKGLLQVTKEQVSSLQEQNREQQSQIDTLKLLTENQAAQIEGLLRAVDASAAIEKLRKELSVQHEALLAAIKGDDK